MLVLAVPTLRLYGPVLAAQRQFPALSEAQRQAQIRTALQRGAGFSAYDAGGAEVQVAPGALTGARPGPCLSVYDRRLHPDSRRRQMPMSGVSGRATFTCLYDLQVEGHGGLGAVIRQQFLTNLHPSWRPPGPQVLSGNEGRYLIPALERRRAAPAGGQP